MVGKLKALLLIALCLPLLGAWPNTGRKYAGVSAGGYSGPGDVVATAKFWVGLRAYNSTLANAGATTTAVIDVRGATTATACTIFLLGNGTGGLDLTTSGAGGLGAQCPSGATTFCTVTNTSCTISQWYDQSGSAKPVAQGTAANQPTLVFSCIGSLPCIQFAGGTQNMVSAAITAVNQPHTVAAVAQATSPTVQQSLWFDNTNSQLGYHTSAANQAFTYGGSAVLTATASDNSQHSLIATFNAASSLLYVDNVAPGSSNIGSGAGGTLIWVGGTISGIANLTGKVEEAGQWSGAFTGTQAGNMCHNQFTYWGTSTSC